MQIVIRFNAAFIRDPAPPSKRGEQRCILLKSKKNTRPTQRANVALAAPVSHSLSPESYKISATTLPAQSDRLTELLNRLSDDSTRQDVLKLW